MVTVKHGKGSRDDGMGDWIAASGVGTLALIKGKNELICLQRHP